MRAHIYQMDLTPENIRLCFAPYEYVLKECCGQISSERYARVYSLEVSAEDPEAIYALLNLHHPSAYAARSLSVSDVIEFEHPDGSSVFYYCDTIGFKVISFDRSTAHAPTP